MGHICEYTPSGWDKLLQPLWFLWQRGPYPYHFPGRASQVETAGDLHLSWGWGQDLGSH